MYRRLLGQSGVIAPSLGVRGPPSYIYTSFQLPVYQITILPTPRVLFCPPTTPTGPPRALIVTGGYIGGNNLLRQGQRQPHQSLRQWNSCILKTVVIDSWDFLRRSCFPCLSCFLHFLLGFLYLTVFGIEQLARCLKIPLLKYHAKQSAKCQAVTYECCGFHAQKGQSTARKLATLLKYR